MMADTPISVSCQRATPSGIADTLALTRMRQNLLMQLDAAASASVLVATFAMAATSGTLAVMRELFEGISCRAYRLG